MFSLKINGNLHQVDVEDEMPLLWVLRDELGMTGTKFGCGIGQCGACTVHVNGEAVRSCSLPVIAVKDKEITTIEGLGENHPVQKAWIEEQVPQCGYCITGQIMATSALLSQNLEPGEKEIENKISNLCRCGNYVRVRKAIRRSAELIQRQEA
jgi:aerobic-type carbon monoxide dehydrogenase small subunit (CoxS/CutS family)